MGILVGGKYYKNPEDAPQQAHPVISQQVKEYDLEQASQKHDRELIQPYKLDGTPNPEFAKYYPELAKEYGMEHLL